MTPPKRKPGFFQLPLHKTGSSKMGGLKAQIQGAYLAASSNERVEKNTPSLAALYEFLRRPLP